jgi:membrane-associated phospholipid phosphatase
MRSGESPYLRRAVLRVVPLSLAVALAAMIFFAWLGEEVLEQNTREFDSRVREYVHQFATPQRTVWMRRASWMGSQLVLLGSVCIVIGLLLARRARLAALFGIAMAGGQILDVALKASFHRLRPQPFFDIPPPHSYAFPSGHALMSFCFYSMMAWMVARWLEPRWQRVLLWCLAAVMIAMVGLSRIYLGVHYPSDVLAGYAAAAVWMSAVEWVGRRFGGRSERDRRISDCRF